MNDMSDLVTDSAKLVSIFGYWPSFHDAEVWSLTQERTQAGFDVVMVIHLFQMTREVTQSGHCKLINHTQAKIRFVDCREIQLAHFNHQNVLFELIIARTEGAAERPLSVSVGASYGLEGEFQCASVIVVDASPWTPPFGVYARKDEE